MTIGELIFELQRYDLNLEVTVRNSNNKNEESIYCIIKPDNTHIILDSNY